MDNRDIEAARHYHESTKLSYINLSNKPPLYKSYQGGELIRLPTGFAQPSISTLEAVGGGVGTGSPHPFQKQEGNSGEYSPLDLLGVARLLFYSAGLIKKRALPVAGEVHYRAAASAGALYPVEVYLVTGDIPGLAAGVYHFSPADFSLRQLRMGDFRRELVRATAGDQAVADAPVTMVFTAVFWRSAWKYRQRGYRYCFWDAGTILANLLATARSADLLPTRLVAGFVDQRVDHLLGINSEREASLCLVSIGSGSGAPDREEPPEAAPAAVEPNDYFPGEIEYPEISQTHTSACLRDEAEVSAWRSVGDSESSSVSEGLSEAPVQGKVRRRETQDPQNAPLGETVLQRGSTRRFSRVPIPSAQLESILESSTREILTDFSSEEAGGLPLDSYVIVNAVDGIRAGAYYYSPPENRLELLKPGAFREEAGHLCFEQALGADAAAVIFLMADLDRILERFGSRGYRAAQLRAGIIVGNTYLCAHSLGLGATGMTFYDDEVVEFFSPHAAGKSLMFLVAVGEIDARNRVRPFRSRVGVLLDSLARGGGRLPAQRRRSLGGPNRA